MQQPSASKSDLGPEYRNRIITHAAINLSLNQNIEDFVIYAKRKVAGIFDDVIIKVWFKEELHLKPFVYVIKTKHDSKDKLLHIVKNVKKFLQSYNQVLLGRNNSEIFKDVPDSIIKFGFFCNKKIEEQSLKKEFLCDIIKRSNNDVTVFPFGNLNLSASQLQSQNSIQHKVFFDNFYLYTEQPSYGELIQEINKLCKTTGSVNMTNYVGDYFKIPELSKNGLSKKIFETELLKMRLSNYIVTPTEFVSIRQEQAKVWNKITLEHYVTLIDDTLDIESSLFGCFVHKVNQLLENTIEWNHAIKNYGKLDQVSIEKFKEISQNLGPRQWTSAPGTIKSLVEALWMYDQLPLILKANQDPSILKEFQHLNKRFIIIGGFKSSDYSVTNVLPPKIFANVQDIVLDSLRKELLQVIWVSLQGRKPVKLYDIVENDQDCLTKLASSMVLKLIRKSNAYLQEECLQSLESMVFVIEDKKSEMATTIDEIEPNENNTYEISCRPYEVQSIFQKINENPKYEYHSVVNLRKAIDSKLEFLNGDKFKLRNFFINEYRDNIYFLDVDEPMPLIGQRLGNREHLYIPRYFRKAIIQHSTFKVQERRICFMSGDVDSLDLDIKKQIIQEPLGDNLEKKLKKNQNVLIDVKEHLVEEYWDTFTTKQCPLFHVKVVHGVMVLLKYRNCSNMNPYLSYSEQAFEESTFFSEITSKITVISGESGIGKTSLVRSLSAMQDEKNYTLICNLAEYRNVLKIGNKELDDCPLDVIFNKFESSPFNELTKAIQEYHKEKKRLILFVDAFDEVLPAHKQAVLHFMENIAKCDVQLIVTSRLFFDTLLINNFEVQPIKIDNFRRKDSEEYFKRQGLSHVKINDIPDELLTNPLFLTFFCYLFREGALDYTRLNKFDIFKCVITKKTERYYRKSNRDFSTSLEAYTSDIFNVHKDLALVELFGKEEMIVHGIVEDYDELVRLFKGLKIKLGIVKHFDNDCPVFLHRSFVEYFAAQWLSERLIDEDFDEVARSLYAKMILDHDRNFRYFFDNMICDNMELHKAVLEGNFELVKKLTDEDPKIIRDTDKCNRDALLLASTHCYGPGNYAVLEELVLKGYLNLSDDMDKYDSYLRWNWIRCLKTLSNDRFLDEVCKRNMAVTVFLYLMAVQDETVTSKNLLNSCENFNIDVACALLTRNESLLPEYYDIVMEMAMKSGRTDVGCKLLELKYRFNSHLFVCNPKSVNLIEFIEERTRGDFTPMHLACMIGNERMAKELLLTESHYDLQESSVYTLDIYGNIPVCYVIMQGNFEIASLLKSKMKDMSFRDKHGNTLLHLACRYLNLAAVNLLLERSVDVNVKNARGETPVHAVAGLKWRELKEIVLTIIAKDAEVKTVYATEKDLVTMSHHSGSYHMSESPQIEKTCRSAIASVLESLFDNYANFTEKDDAGNTALHTAYRNSNKLVFEYLSRSCPKLLFIRDRNGSTVFDLAQQDGNLKMWDSLFASATSGVEDSCTDDDRMSLDEDLEIGNHAETIDDNVMAEVSSLTVEEESSIKNDLKFVEERGWTLLHKAVTRGRSDVIELLVEKEFPTDIPDDEGCIPLHLATSQYDVDLLLKKRTNLKDVNRKSHNDETPLHTASRSGRLDVVKALLTEKADCAIKNIFGLTPLHIACITNNVDIVKSLVGHGANVDEPNKNGATVLHLATSERNAPLVDFLLDANADSTLRDDSGNIPLHLACQCGCMAIVERLVSKSPWTLKFRNKNGYRPYDLACVKGKREVVEYLLKICTALDAGVSEKILCEIVEMGHLTILKALFETGVLTEDDLDCRGRRGNTLLHEAIWRDDRNVVQFLLEKGARIDVVNDDLYTPLHLVQSVKCADLLSKYFDIAQVQAQVHARSKYNETPLHMVCAGINQDLARFFLDNGADVSCKDIAGWTPLHIAVSANAIETVEILLENGANVNETNKYSATALHIAATENVFMVELLLAHDADINAINKYGIYAIQREKQLLDGIETKIKTIGAITHTVLDMACLQGEAVINYLLVQHPIVKDFKLSTDALFNMIERGNWMLLWKLFREKIICGTDLKCTKENGNTLLHAAAYRGHIEVIHFLEEHSDIELNALNDKGQTPLVVAAIHGHIEIVRHLLPHARENESQQTWTVLHAAVYKNNIKLVREILKLNVNVNVTTKNGNSALHTAVIGGYTGIINVLIEHKIRIDFVNKCGWTAFDVACILNRCNIIKCLVNSYPTLRNRKVSNHTLFAIVRKGSWKSLKVLLDESVLVGNDLYITDEYQRSLLHTAVCCQRTEFVKFLLETGVKVNPLDCEGHMPLHLARSGADAKLLIDRYENVEDINAGTITGSTPLHMACYHGCDDVVQVLLEAKANVSATMEDGSTPLHVATKRGENVKIVEMLLEHQSPVNQPDKTFKTALHIATSLGALYVVQALVKRGAHIGLEDEEGNTALHLACKMGHLKILEYLTGFCVDVISSRNKREYTPFDYACLLGNPDVIEYLLERHSDIIRNQLSDVVLYDIVCRSQLETLKLILRYNIITKEDLEQPLRKGYTSLHLATLNNDVEMSRFLLEQGVNVKRADEEGMRPIHYVKTAEAANLLLNNYQNPMDIYERSHSGRTPLHTASKRGRADIIRLFLSRQAAVSARDKSEWTPLLLAAYANEVECVEILLENGADVNEANDQSETALHLAVQNASWALIDVLLDKGADVKLKDNNGDTVLHSVLKCYRWNTWFVESPIHDNEVARDNVVELIGKLLERGADPFEVNSDGESAQVLVKELKLNDLSHKMSYKKRRLNNEDITE